MDESKRAVAAEYSDDTSAFQQPRHSSNALNEKAPHAGENTGISQSGVKRSSINHLKPTKSSMLRAKSSMGLATSSEGDSSGKSGGISGKVSQ